MKGRAQIYYKNNKKRCWISLHLSLLLSLSNTHTCKYESFGRCAPWDVRINPTSHPPAWKQWQPNAKCSSSHVCSLGCRKRHHPVSKPARTHHYEAAELAQYEAEFAEGMRSSGSRSLGSSLWCVFFFSPSPLFHSQLIWYPVSWMQIGHPVKRVTTAYMWHMYLQQLPP